MRVADRTLLPPARVAAIAAVAVVTLALAVGCTRSAATTPDPTTATAATGTTGTTGPTGTGTTAAPGTSTTTAAPTTTESTTTTEPPTTETTSTRPPRPLPPKAGRPAPPEALALPGHEVVAGEGLWSPLGTPVGGAPAMYSTLFRTSTSGSALAGIVWIDNTAVRGQLLPGATQPGGTWSVPFNIPLEQKPSLLAAFNSGFLLGESQGGFYLEGNEAVPLRNGSAAVYIDNDGYVNVGALGRDFHVGPDTAAVRQNLPLLVDGGVVASSATDGDARVWGKTLGGGSYVWRSGFGARADGTLVYVGGPSMSARMLGNTLVAAGAVRAMELDINPNWVTFNWFNCTPAGDCNGTRLLPSMLRDGNRYLLPDNRDFFALFARPTK